MAGPTPGMTHGLSQRYAALLFVSARAPPVPFSVSPKGEWSAGRRQGFARPLVGNLRLARPALAVAAHLARTGLRGPSRGARGGDLKVGEALPRSRCASRRSTDRIRITTPLPTPGCGLPHLRPRFPACSVSGRLSRDAPLPSRGMECRTNKEHAQEL